MARRNDKTLLLSRIRVLIPYLLTCKGTYSLTYWAIEVTRAQGYDDISLLKGLTQKFVRKIIDKNKSVVFFDCW